MRTSIVVAAGVLLGACGGGSSAPREPIAWTPGRYSLEASISYQTRNQMQVDRQIAELVIEPDGRMSLIGMTGPCLDPSPAQVQEDEARGRRTFECQDARYELRPVAGGVVGQMVAEVTEEFMVTVCVRYEQRPDGTQVCVEEREEVEQRRALKNARLQVLSVR